MDRVALFHSKADLAHIVDVVVERSAGMKWPRSWSCQRDGLLCIAGVVITLVLAGGK
jgi:hypothetical protein